MLPPPQPCPPPRSSSPSHPPVRGSAATAASLRRVPGREGRAPPPPRCRLQLETIREYAANLDLTLVQGGVGPFITFDAFYTPPPRRRPLGHPSLSQRGAPPPLLRRSRRGGWLPSRATR